MTVANPPTTIAAATTRRPQPVKASGMILGVLAGFDADGAPLIQAGASKAVAALTVVELGREHIGARVALQFDGGDPAAPVVMGVVRAPRADAGRGGGAPAPLLAVADDEELVLVAHRRITLMCGAASITLDADGNIDIRGKHLLSRASGQNRIKGGSVSLN